MKLSILSLFAISLFMTSCIGDDVIDDKVPEAVRILNPLDTLGVGETYQFEAMFTNQIGVEEERPVIWETSDPAVITIDNDGLAAALAKGNATISATVDIDGVNTVREENEVVVDEETVVTELTKSGTIRTTSSYNLGGDFIVEEENGSLVITIADNYEASTALPGLYVYLSNNPNTISSAFEISRVDVFDGAHSYQIDGIGINDYQYLLYWCKPFNVKVGDGLIE
ncbi:MAG: Ig-like domain-containing protein [Bacteroidota bacterium]